MRFQQKLLYLSKNRRNLANPRKRLGSLAL